MGDVDIASLVVALTGAAALITGHVQNKRGHKAQQVQQRTADTLASQAQEFTQHQAIIENLNRDLVRKNEELDRKDRHHAAEMARCVEVRAELAATLALVSEVVRDEVAKAMVATVLEKDARHTDTDH